MAGFQAIEQALVWTWGTQQGAEIFIYILPLSGSLSSDWGNLRHDSKWKGKETDEAQLAPEVPSMVSVGLVHFISCTICG